jgi:hypothetical protein
MRTLTLILSLTIAPMTAFAQADTLAPPPVPAAPAVPAPPVAPAQTSRTMEKSVVIERKGGFERITVVEGDTTIIITEGADGKSTVVMTTKDGEGPVNVADSLKRRAYIAAGMDKSGTYVRLGSDGEGDTTRSKDPVVIELKRKTIRIYSEDKETPSDSARIAEKIKEFRTERRNKFTYWAGLDLGLNNWVGPDGDADLDKEAEFMQLDAWRSRFFAINFMEQKVEFGSHHAGLMTGLGLEYTSYHLINNVQLAYNADSVYGIVVDDPTYTKNKLRQTGLRVPLMLEFNTKRAPLPTTAEEVKALEKKDGYSRKGNFHLAMGVVGSWYFDTMYKQKYTAYGDKQKDRSSGDFHLLPYRAAASVRLGWGGWNFFGEYALTELFRDGKGPSLTPFNVGLTIIGFN